MEHLRYYTFNTELEAKQAIDKINAHFGIPASPDAVTQTYIDYHVDEDGIYFIQGLEELKPILGEPIDFTPKQNK